MDKTAEAVWNNALTFIKDNINDQSFKTWFDPIKPLKLENKVLTIQVPSQFFYEDNQLNLYLQHPQVLFCFLIHILLNNIQIKK